MSCSILLYIFIVVKIHNVKLTILHTFNVKYIHTVMQQIFSFFILQKWNSIPIENHSPFPLPWLLATTILLSMNLTTLNASYKQNHTVFVFLWLGYFTLHNVLKAHLCCSMWPSFLPFLRLSNTVSYEYVTFGLPFICQWAFGLLPPLGYCKSCCYEHGYANISLRTCS